MPPIGLPKIVCVYRLFCKIEVDVADAGAACGYLTIVVVAAAAVKKKHRSVWVKPWIVERPVCAAYHRLLSDLLNSDEVLFRNFIRMILPAFEELLSRVKFGLTKARTRLRQPISA